MTESDELIRLRAKVAELEGRLEAHASTVPTTGPAHDPGHSGRPRAAAAAVLDSMRYKRKAAVT